MTSPKPLMKKWNLYFLKTGGFENRERIINSLVEFMKDRASICMEMPGNCMFFGEIYGHDLYKEGGRIITSNVLRIERCKTENSNNHIHDLFCVVTKTGKYFCYSDECGSNMKRMLEDLINTGSLNRMPGWYLEKSRFTKGGKLL